MLSGAYFILPGERKGIIARRRDPSKQSRVFLFRYWNRAEPGVERGCENRGGDYRGKRRHLRRAPAGTAAESSGCRDSPHYYAIRARRLCFWRSAGLAADLKKMAALFLSPGRYWCRLASGSYPIDAMVMRTLFDPHHVGDRRRHQFQPAGARRRCDSQGEAEADSHGTGKSFPPRALTEDDCVWRRWAPSSRLRFPGFIIIRRR